MRYKRQPGNASTGYYRQEGFHQRDAGSPLRVLSEEQWQHWEKKGYVIVPDAVPSEQIERLVALIWLFEEKDPQDRSTWYRPPRREIEMSELVGSGMVEIYNHQFLWDNRQYPKVYDAFVDIWGTEKLWVSIDRANLNFPIRRDSDFSGFIHWDIDTSDPNRANNVQGTISLTDTSEETGGFQCIPELYQKFDDWVKTQPEGRDPFRPDITNFEIEQVSTKKGDLLIWNSMLAHGIRPNRSDLPRLAQYVAMSPAREDDEALRAWRIESWRNRLPPEGYAFPGDPREWEQHHAKTARLSELGKKLLGLDSWSGSEQD